MTQDLSIRPYKAEDEPQLISLWKACGLVVPHNDPLRDIERKRAVNPEWLLVGKIDGELVASCMVGYEGHRGWINYLAVSPNLQRQSIASALMSEAEKLLKQAGCPKVNLQIRETNSAVIEFYKSIGYTIDPVVSMGKRLEVD